MENTQRNNGNEHRTLKAVGGALLFILGVVAINSSIVTSFAAVSILGWLLAIGGVIGFIMSFAIPNAGGVILGMVSSILSFVLGGLMVVNPGLSLATLTLLLSMYFIVDGVIRIAVSFSGKLEHWGWSLVYGLIILAFGIAVWTRLPISSLYIFGILIGVGLILKGITLLGTSFGPQEATTQRHHFA